MFTKIDLCLLCLTNDSKLKSILSEDSDGVIIDEKLKFFISKQIKTEPEDSMLYICLPCLEKLNNVYNYKRLCLWNISSLNSFIHKFKPVDKPCSSFQISLIDIQIANINEVNKPNSDSITTENCKVNKSNEDQTQHKQKPEDIRATITKENNQMECTNISDNTENNKAQEENITKQEDLDDNEINFEFVHVFVKEEPKDNYADETDNNEAESSSTNGPRSVDKNIHKCNECHKTFESSAHLSAHTLSHTGEKPYKCDVCDKAFYHQTSLDRHKFTHSGIRPFKCDTCDKTFNLSCTLLRHKLSHTGEKPHKCDVCDKAFHLQNLLVRHKLIHSGAKPYKCDICNKAFSQNSSLVEHKRLHTGEKPYKCDVCDKGFTKKYHLKTHKRCHTGEKPYKCDICDVAFRDRSNLVKHKRCHGETL